MTGNRIGVGFIGLSARDGWAARAHVPALKSLPEFEIRALTASSRQSAAEAARKYGVPHFFDSAAELAARPEVDLVVVTVRVSHHRELVEAALHAGKMVYCEWPLGNGLGEAEEMAALAETSGVRNFVGLQAHAAPAVRYIRDLVTSGYVGDVVSTTVVASAGAWGASVEPRLIYGLDRSNGVSMLTVQFSHTIDGLCWCLGEFRELSATLGNRYPRVRRTDTGEMLAKTTDDQIAVCGTLESGALASIHFRAGLSRGTNFLWEINGTGGDMVVTGDLGRLQYGQVRIQGANGLDKGLADLPVPAKYKLVAGSPEDLSYTVAHAYARLLSDIRNGTAEVPTFYDAVVRHRMIEAIQRASDTGMRQRYDSPGR